MSKYRIILSDPEFWFILVFNVFIAKGYWDAWLSMDTVIWIYFTQSVFIGLANAVRMTFLGKYTNEKTKWSSLFVVMLPYGFIHLIYFIYLFIFSINNGSKLDFRMVMVNLLAIAGNTLISVWSNVLQDKEKPPAIQSLFFSPYLRIVPMHIFIILGIILENKGSITLPGLGMVHIFWIFLILKSMVDVWMHILVQQSWRQARIKPMEGFI